MNAADPKSALQVVGLSEIRETLLHFVAKVEIKPILSSAGVRPVDDMMKQFVIVMSEFYQDKPDLLGSFVHEVLHIFLFVRFGVIVQESLHPQIRLDSERLVKQHERELEQLLTDALGADLEKSFEFEVS